MFASIHSQTIPDGMSLADFAYTFSPLVEETSIDTVVIDIAGCELLFGSAYELANEIASRTAKAKEMGGLGCKVNVAVAGNPDAAVYAARFLKGITFISPGEERICLGELPIEALLKSPMSYVQSPTSKAETRMLSKTKDQRQKTRHSTLDFGLAALDEKQREEILVTLRLWGIHTFADFAALPVAGVSERLGQTGVRLQLLAGGKTERHLRLRQPSPTFTSSIELDYPIIELEPLSFILARLLNQICASLHAYALATNELRLYLKLENGIHERRLSLPNPMRDPRVFLRLLLLNLEMHPPQSAVTAITINCEPVKPRALQSGLFIPLAPEPEKLALTLARLAKLVGADNVGSMELLDTHRPDAFRVKRFGDINYRRRGGHRVDPKSDLRNSKCLLGFRVFRPPLRALVQDGRGYPTEISAWGANRSVHGKVVRVAGPWRTTGDWWRLDRWARDEWDVAVESRSADLEGEKNQPVYVLYRLYRELPNGAWFVAGTYD